MDYRPDDFMLLPRHLRDEARQADSIWGHGYAGMTYMGSEIEGPNQKGFYRSTDYFRDKDGSIFWHARYFRIHMGDLVFYTSSEYLYGHLVTAWDRETKEKK